MNTYRIYLTRVLVRWRPGSGQWTSRQLTQSSLSRLLKVLDEKARTGEARVDITDWPTIEVNLRRRSK